MNITPGRKALIERTWDGLGADRIARFISGSRGPLLHVAPVPAFEPFGAIPDEVEAIEYRRHRTPTGALVVTSGPVVVHREPYDRQRHG